MPDGPEVIVIKPGREYILRVEGSLTQGPVQIVPEVPPTEPSFRDLLKGTIRPYTPEQTTAAGNVRRLAKLIARNVTEAQSLDPDDLLKWKTMG